MILRVPFKNHLFSSYWKHGHEGSSGRCFYSNSHLQICHFSTRDRKTEAAPRHMHECSADSVSASTTTWLWIRYFGLKTELFTQMHPCSRQGRPKQSVQSLQNLWSILPQINLFVARAVFSVTLVRRNRYANQKSKANLFIAPLQGRKLSHLTETKHKRRCQEGNGQV